MIQALPVEFCISQGRADHNCATLFRGIYPVYKQLLAFWTLTDSEINPWSAISLNYASKLFPPILDSQTPQQTDSVNIQADIENIRAPKRALKSAYVNSKLLQSFNFKFNLQIASSYFPILLNDSLN